MSKTVDSAEIGRVARRVVRAMPAVSLRDAGGMYVAFDSPIVTAFDSFLTAIGGSLVALPVFKNDIAHLQPVIEAQLSSKADNMLNRVNTAILSKGGLSKASKARYTRESNVLG